MSKILQTNIRNGSAIESYSGVAGIISNASFSKTEKGLALTGSGAGNINFGNIDGKNVGTSDFALEFSFKVQEITSDQRLVHQDSGGIGYRIYLSGGRIRLAIGNGTLTYQYLTSVDSFEVNIWYHILINFDRDGNAEAHVNSVADSQVYDISSYQGTLSNAGNIYVGSSGLSFFGNMGDVAIYDHILTPQERAKLYSDFLNASPITRAIKDNLNYPALKPHDLSHLVDARIGNPDTNPFSLMDEGKGTFTLQGGGELSDFWTNSTAHAYETFITDGIDIVSAINIGGNGSAYIADLTVTQNEEYQVSFDIVINSGTAPKAVIAGDGDAISSAKSSTFDVVDGHNEFTILITAAGTASAEFLLWNSVAMNYSVTNFSIQKVINDSATENWTVYGINVMVNENNALKITYADHANGAFTYLRETQDMNQDLVVGKTYQVFTRVKVNAGSTVSVNISDSGSTSIGTTTSTEYIWLSNIFTAKNTTGAFLFFGLGAGEIIWLDQWYVKEWDGEELVPDEDVGLTSNLVANWIATGANTLAQIGNAVECTYVDADNGMQMLFTEANGTMFNNPVAGDKIRFVFKVKVNTGTVYLRIADDSGGDWISTTFTEREFSTVIYDYTVLDDNLYFRFDNLGVGEVATIEIISVMKVTGLKAAYNMIPNGETLVDISGEGNNGAFIGTKITSTKKGLAFDGGGYVSIDATNGLADVQDYANDARFTIACTVQLRSIPVGDSPVWVAGDGRLSLGWDTATGWWFGYYDGSEYTQLSFGLSFAIIGEWVTLVAVNYANDLIGFYLDGVSGGATSGVLLPTGGGLCLIGARTTTSFSTGIEVGDIRVFNYAFSEQEAIAYHNQFAKEVKHKDRLALDFGVGDTI